MTVSRRAFVKFGALMGAGVLVPTHLVERAAAFTVAFQGIAQNPLTLDKYVQGLPVPGVMPAASRNMPNYYKVGMYQFKSRVHPEMKPTTVWGYRPVGFNWRATYTTPQSTWLGPSFAIRRNTRTKVEWQNHLILDGKPIAHPLPVDPSLMWA
ncbi:MAG: hypothetical protein HY876_05655, partial [Coriobacteriales bacterium]|nr:hypothetical protein [Coriobacteriales bacterium]